MTQAAIDPAKAVDPAASALPEDIAKMVATGRLFQALGSDPKFRPRVLALIKEVAPETPIPEIDMQKALTDTLESRLKPADETFKKISDRLDNIDRNLQRGQFAKKHNLSDEELVEVETFAKEGQIGNSDFAVNAWRMQQQLGTPRGTRKTLDGTQEYLDKLGKVNPRNGNALKALAVEEGTRLFSKLRKG